MINILLPTYNEQGNIEEVIARIRHAMGGHCYIITVIDDGHDNTSILAADMGAETIKGDRKGLSAAVIKGIEASRADHIIVMDADLQHPPEILPSIISHFNRYDMVIGSRYCKGASVGNWDKSRLYISKLTNLLSIHLAPGVKDRLTGYFGFKRSKVDVGKLNGTGFKILLEILAKNELKVTEVPITFGTRKAGQSKADAKVGIEYIKQVIKLTPHSHIFKFGLVGMLGAVIGLSILWLLTEQIGLYYLVSYFISTLIAISSNWYWNSRFTFQQSHTFKKWFKYLQMSAGTLILNTVIMFVLTSVIGIYYLLSAVITIGIIFLLNFYLSRRYVWSRNG